MSNLSNLPTLTVIRCGTTKVGHNGGRQGAAHDPPLDDNEGPVESAQTLMLDLAINELTSDSHRILIVSSPFRRCLESAVLIAQAMGVPAIQVHYGLTEQVSNLRNAGWDWEVSPLYMSEREMRNVVALQSRSGERRGLNRVTIEEFVGKKMTVDDINEAEEMALDRIATALEEIRNSILQPGDHAIAVGHLDTIHALANKYGPKGIEVLRAQSNGFLTVKTMSQNCFWLGGRSKVKVTGEV